MSRNISVSIPDEDKWIFDAIEKTGKSKSEIAVLALKFYFYKSSKLLQDRYQIEIDVKRKRYELELKAMEEELQQMKMTPGDGQMPIPAAPTPSVVDPVQIWESKVPGSDPPRSYNFIYGELVGIFLKRKKDETSPTKAINWLDRYGGGVDAEAVFKLLKERLIREEAWPKHWEK